MDSQYPQKLRTQENPRNGERWGFDGTTKAIYGVELEIFQPNLECRSGAVEREGRRNGGISRFPLGSYDLHRLASLRTKKEKRRILFTEEIFGGKRFTPVRLGRVNPDREEPIQTRSLIHVRLARFH